MNSFFWLAVLIIVVAAAWLIARIRRTVHEKKLAEEARVANFLAGHTGVSAAGPVSPAPAAPVELPARPRPDTAPVEPPRPRPASAADGLAQQKLLFESAHKAGEAGEPALAIQLYARLLVRYPSSAFADQARAGAEAQKKKLVKP